MGGGKNRVNTQVSHHWLISQLSERAKSIVRDLDPANELTYLRIKSRKHEILVAPEDDFILIVVQNPPEPLKNNE